MQKSPTKKLKIALIILLLTNFITAIFLGRAIYNNWWSNHLWEIEMYGQSGENGRFQAVANFRANRKYLYEIYFVPKNVEQNGKSKFTGRADGPFQIWTYPCYTILGDPHKKATQTFIEFHNREMRRLQQKFASKTSQQAG